MADHIVDQIAEAFVDLCIDADTPARDRFTRDRDNADGFAIDELPAGDVTIGEDNPTDEAPVNFWESEVEMRVDLYAVANAESSASKRLLQLRKETFIALMATNALTAKVSEVLSITPGGATEVSKMERGEIQTASFQTVFFVKYRHSLTDPSTL